MKPVRLAEVRAFSTGVKEASDVAALPGGRFLVVSDQKTKVRVLNADSSYVPVEIPDLPKNESQFEAVTFDSAKERLIIVREEARELLRYRWSPDSSRPPTLDEKKGRVALDKGGPKNKGFEGMTYVPAEFSPTGSPMLLLAKEGNPKQLWVHDATGAKTKQEVKLDPSVFDACKDFSALAIHPKTGHLYIASDESGSVVEVALRQRDDGKIEGSRVSRPYAMRDRENKRLNRIEGLVFTPNGRLHALTENDGKLHEFVLPGDAPTVPPRKRPTVRW